MVASRSSRFVPLSLLVGASCLLPVRQETSPVVSASRPLATLVPDLTPAELRVRDLLLTGLSNKEIASELNRAEATIKNQVASILHKHGVPSRARLLAMKRQASV
ncbi:MAG: response regulator transcription factor [Candidatus Didemnitutus sp.]|nr:response regulator transcription factor [Candidatus Didemnitutus sp.]